MNPRRGDVVLAWFPFASGTGGKLRPCVVVSADRDNARLSNIVVVQITTNLRAAGEPTQVYVAANSPDGASAGLIHDSLVSCNNPATIHRTLVARVIGYLPPAVMAAVDDALRAALDLP